MQEYADPVIDWLDAGTGILSHRFFRDVRAHRLVDSVFSGPHLHFGLVMHTATQWVIYQGLVNHRTGSRPCLFSR